MDGRFVSYAAIGFSAVSIIACVLIFPLLHQHMAQWQLTIQQRLRQVQVFGDDTWNEMIKVREELGFDRHFLSPEQISSANAKLRQTRQSSYEGVASGQSYPAATQSQATIDPQNQWRQTQCTPEMGLPGQAGYPGQNGLDGEPGKNGESGFDARDVTPVAFDVPCTVCPQGPPGSPGGRGSNGRQGRQGPAGADGRSGTPGRPGSSGDKGSPGQPGRPGQQGAGGRKGSDTLAGKGLPGQKGSNGERGSAGAPGNRGRTGGRGRPGQGGQPGLGGRNGNRGHAGLPGQQGAPGLPGGDAQYCSCRQDQTGQRGPTDQWQQQQQQVHSFGSNAQRQPYTE